MKCCICNKDKTNFLINTDLCLDCSSEISKKRSSKKRQKIQGINIPQKELCREFPRGKCFVYRFLEGKDILYIGKSSSLGYRVQNHLSTSPFNHITTSIEICPMKSYVDMDIYEVFLINKHRPKFNKRIAGGLCSFNLHEEGWIQHSVLEDALFNIKFKKVNY